MTVLALETPAKNRVQNNMKALTASPLSATNPANATLAKPTIGPRRTRSASQPSGPAPSMKNATDATEMKVMVPSLTSSVSAMSGPRMLIAALSSSSKELRASSTENVKAPPLRSPSRNSISSEPTPGSRSSANRTAWERSAWAACRAASSSRTVAVSDAAERGSSSVAVNPTLPLSPSRRREEYAPGSREGDPGSVQTVGRGFPSK